MINNYSPCWVWMKSELFLIIWGMFNPHLSWWGQIEAYQTLSDYKVAWILPNKGKCKQPKNLVNHQCQWF